MTVASYSYCVKMMQYPILRDVLEGITTDFAFIRDEDVPKYSGHMDIAYDRDETDREGPVTEHAYVLRESLPQDVKIAVPAPTMSEMLMAFSMLHDRGYGGRLDLSFDNERGDYAIFTPEDGRRFRSFNVKINFPKSNYVEDYLAIALIAVMEEMKEAEP